jgi:hypothetical protein
MASNKNQHYVPRCYLKPFTLDGAGVAINVFNIDRKIFIGKAPVKNQCSGNYFYGSDLVIEKELQKYEGDYANGIKEILSEKYELVDKHRDLLKQFWLLQYLRTDAASRKVVEMSIGVEDFSGLSAGDFRLQLKEAVQISMNIFAEMPDILSDLKVCLVRNRTNLPFVTSDDPAVLSNRWYMQDARTKGMSFGLPSAGALMFLPISPAVLCIIYDGDIYNIPHKNGWIDVRHDRDVSAYNQHQFLNCRANIFYRDLNEDAVLAKEFEVVQGHRIASRYKITYAVLDRVEGDIKVFRAVRKEHAGDHESAMIHMQTINAAPLSWPLQFMWRNRGFAFTNGSGVGYVRREKIEARPANGFGKPFVKVYIN